MKVRSGQHMEEVVRGSSGRILEGRIKRMGEAISDEIMADHIAKANEKYESPSFISGQSRYLVLG